MGKALHLHGAVVMHRPPGHAAPILTEFIPTENFSTMAQKLETYIFRHPNSPNSFSQPAPRSCVVPPHYFKAHSPHHWCLRLLSTLPLPLITPPVARIKTSASREKHTNNLHGLNKQRMLVNSPAAVQMPQPRSKFLLLLCRNPFFFPNPTRCLSLTGGAVKHSFLSA